MTWWDDYQRRRSQSIKDELTDNLKNTIRIDFKSSTSYNLVQINNIDRDVRIVEESSVIKNPNRKRLLCLPDETINVGDIVHYNNSDWICTEIDNNSNVSHIGLITRCNNILTFYKNNILYHIPCIFTDGSISLEEGKFLTLPSSHYMVIIPSGVITKDDLNLRFILNDAPYKVVGISNATNGLIKIEVQDDVFKDEDNRALGIADYTINQSNYEIMILNGTEATLYGGVASTLQLNILCKKNGIIIENPEVIYSSSDITVCTVDSSGLISVTGTGTSDIKVTYGDAFDSIKITSLMSVQDNFEVVITPDDTSMYVNKTKTYTATVTNNGIDEPYYGITWEVINIDLSTNEYCTYLVDGKSIIITAKNMINKQIKIKATFSSNTTVFDERIVTIRSLL